MSKVIVELSELCDVITKGTTPSNIGAEFTEKGIKYIRSEMLTSAKYISDEGLLYISEETHKKLKRSQLKPGDILFSMAGVYLGKTAILRECDTPANTNQAVALIRIIDEKCNREYVYYYLNLPEVVKSVNSITGQSAQPNINLKQIGNIQIMLPERSVQDAVVTILSTYDSLIANNQKQIKLLEEAAQRLYKEWFVDLRFPDHETTPIVDGVPEGWKVRSLTEVANVVMGQSPKSEFYNREGKGLPFHQGVGSFGARFVIDSTYSTSFTRIAEAGSILFSVRAPVGRLNITKNKVVIGRGLAAINHRAGKQSYLFYLLKERFFKDDIIGNGAIFASISKDELLGQKFMVPTDEIVDRFDAIVRDIDRKIAGLADQIILLTEARDRLLPKLMNGEIEV